ncbi:MAG: ABC transporter permease [Syntrophales bacterium]|nr:ABC transporter permease [Syntrophales bacterium]
MIRKRIWVVMKAEFLHIIRDPLSLIIALFMPLFLLFLCAYTLTFELKELPIAAYDMDQSKESRDYLNLVDHTSYFRIQYYLNEYKQAGDLLATGKTRCVIIIPTGFSREVKEYLPAGVQILVDGSDTNSALQIVNYLSAINASRSVEMAASVFKKNGLTVNLEPVKLIPRTWYNQSLREFTFTVTGTLSLAVLAFVPILSALAIVREKESGSIQQIFVSPVKSYEYIAGKMSPYVILLTLDFIFVTLFALWWFNLPMRGSFLIISLANFFMVFACVAIGFFISTLTKSQLVAMLLGIIFTLMPAFIVGDTLFPLEYSPRGILAASFLFPARFHSGIIRAQILKGSDFSSYWGDALSLVVYCVAIFSVCAWMVRKKKI